MRLRREMREGLKGKREHEPLKDDEVREGQEKD